MFSAFYVELIFSLPPLNYGLCFTYSLFLHYVVCHSNPKSPFAFQKWSIMCEVDVDALDIYFILTLTST